jgi:iron complex transport system substrate-binding protein
MQNRFLKYFALMLAGVLTAGIALGCALPSPVPADDSAAQDGDLFYDGSSIDGAALIDVTDMAGNAVQLDSFASRIVVLDAADCEILCAIGAAGQIVGRSDACDYPESVASIPSVTADGTVSPERILELKPQVVVLSANEAQDADLLSALQSAGVQPVVTDATDVNGVYTAITLLGAIADRVAEAGSLVANMLTAFAGIQEKTANSASQSVYFELSPLADGLETAGSGTLLNSIAALLGLKNEFEDLQGYASITQDQVVGRNPDIIVTTTPDGVTSTVPATTDGEETSGNALGATDEIMERPGWEDVAAVARQRVYAADGEALTRPGPRLLDAVTALYDAIYAE